MRFIQTCRQRGIDFMSDIVNFFVVTPLQIFAKRFLEFENASRRILLVKVVVIDLT